MMGVTTKVVNNVLDDIGDFEVTGVKNGIFVSTALTEVQGLVFVVIRHLHTGMLVDASVQFF